MLFTSDHLKMITELLDNDSGKMNRWEIGFIESSDAQMEKGCALTGPQIKQLKKIWDKVFN